MKATVKPIVKYNTTAVPIMGKMNTVQQGMSGPANILPYIAKEKRQTNKNKKRVCCAQTAGGCFTTTILLLQIRETTVDSNNI